MKILTRTDLELFFAAIFFVTDLDLFISYKDLIEKRPQNFILDGNVE
jgi:hypothetical protein